MICAAGAPDIRSEEEQEAEAEASEAAWEQVGYPLAFDFST